MRTEDLIRNLKYVKNKYKNRRVFTGEVNIYSMCDDVIKKLEELQPKEGLNCSECSRRKFYQKGFEDAKRELEKIPEVSKEFLEDCAQTAKKYKIKTHIKVKPKLVITPDNPLEAYHHFKSCPHCKKEFKCNILGYNYVEAIGETKYCPYCGGALKWRKLK